MDLFDTYICAPLRLQTDGAIVAAGLGWKPIFAWPPEELVGQQLQALCVPHDQARLYDAIQRVAHGAPSAIVRARFERPGNPWLIQFRLQLQADEILVIAEDVGARETIAAESSGHLDAVAAFASDIWLIHDLEGRIRDVNRYAERALGYRREELLSMVVADIEMTIKPGRLDGVWKRMEVGRPRTVEGRQRRKDGSEFPVEVRLGLFQTDDEEILMLAIARDITPRKQQEAELQALNQLLSDHNDRLESEVAARTAQLADALAERSLVVEHISDGLVAVDPKGAIRLVNPALDGLFGRDRVTVGAAASDCLPAALVELLHQTEAAGEECTADLELTDGRVASAIANPLYRQGAPAGAVAVLRDVTLARQVDQMKTDFIATVSHELRTPLTSVLGFAKITANQLHQKIAPHLPNDNRSLQRAMTRVTGNVDIIVREGQRLTALINDVLDISKMEAGRMEWQMGPVDLPALVDATAQAASGLFESKDVTFRVEVDPNLPQPSGDTHRLQQVLLNLIGNAAKFTETGEVVLSATHVPGGVELAVRDTGIGIEASHHASVFERFRQVGDTLTNKPTGTGLGLAICMQIVQAHGTKLTLDSELGKGSRFAFELPMADLAPVNAERVLERIEREVARSGRPIGHDILVVDDDPSLRELLRQQLTDRGYHVRLAPSGMEAMTQVRTRRPDLILLDVMMPELSGFDVAAMLKSDPETQRIPIVILSIVQDKARGLRTGVDRYLNKPIEADDLARVIRELLGSATSSRRVLVVDDRAPAVHDIQELLLTKGYQIVGTATDETAVDEALRTHPDLIVVDRVSNGSHRVVEALRFQRGLEDVVVVQLVENQPPAPEEAE